MVAMKLRDIPCGDLDALLERYELILLDAFGVLLSTDGVLPGAVGLIDRLNRSGQAYAVVTNDASKHASTSAARYRARGLAIDDARVITSGSLIPRYFQTLGLTAQRPRCLVMGPEDSRRHVIEAGGVLIDPDEHGTLDALIVCDDAGYPLLETIDAAISMIFRGIDRGEPPHLIVPNPDLIYPKGGGRFGITAGSVALMIEAAIQLRYPEGGFEFARLGKPFPSIYEAAFERGGSRDAVLFGDQLQTDIRGANRVGIDSVLMLGTGVTPLDLDVAIADVETAPTYRMSSLV